MPNPADQVLDQIFSVDGAARHSMPEQNWAFLITSKRQLRNERKCSPVN
jgi:hypothetical protein